MLARDWYYNERRQLGLGSAVASIYARHDDSDIRARAALTMLGVQRGWRVADIGCGHGVLGREAGPVGAAGGGLGFLPGLWAPRSPPSIFRRPCWRWWNCRRATARSRSGPSRRDCSVSRINRIPMI